MAHHLLLGIALLCCACTSRAQRTAPEAESSRSTAATRAAYVEATPQLPPQPRAVLVHAQKLLDEARAAQQANDAARAREKAAQAIDAMLEQCEDIESGDWIALASELGTFARDAGELRASERAWRKVLDIRVRTLPADHPEVQRARGNLAVTLYTLGELQEAQALFESTLDVFSRTLPDDDLDLQLARQGLAATKSGLGDLRGARVLFEQVLDVRARTLPAEHPEVLRARQNLAATLYSLGDLHGARALLEQVLDVAVRTLPDDDPELSRARGNLASVIQALGDLHGARVLQERVLEAQSRLLPDDHPDLQLARQGLALTLRLLGDLRGALALEEQVLDVRSRTLPDDHPDLQAARLNYALTIQALGDLQGARMLEERVLETFSRTLPDDHPRIQAARTDLALTLRSLGDLQGARSLFEQVLDVCSRALPEDHPELQAARLNLALTIKDLGEREAAKALEMQVLEAYSRTLPDDHPDLQAARSNLALTLRSLGDLEGARVLFEQVLAVRTRTLPSDHPDLRRARGNLALVLGALGDPQGARTLLETVLESAQRALPDEHPDLQLARLNLACAIAHLPADDATRSAFVDLARVFTVAMGRSAQAAILEVGPREADERCARLLADVSWSLSFAAGFGGFPADADLNRAAFVASEQTRGAAILASTWTRSARTDAGFEPLRAALEAATEELARLAQRGATPGEFRAARERREAAERALVAFAQAHVSGVAPDMADLSRLSATLRDTDAIVSYRRYTHSTIDRANERDDASTEDLCAFVVRSGDRLVRVDLGPIKPVEDAVARWRRSIGVDVSPEVRDGSSSRAESTEAERGIGARPAIATGGAESAEELRRIVFDPLRDALHGASRLIVCPDDVVCLVPLEALPGDANRHEDLVHEGALLGDRLRIETRTTVLELLSTQSRSAGTGALVALGDPAFDRDPTLEPPAAIAHLPARVAHDAGVLRGSTFSDLSSTRTEVIGIAAHFETCFGESAERSVLERAEASREKLFALAPRARFLHLATHGWFAPETIRSWSDPEPLDAQFGWGARMDLKTQVRGMTPMLLCGLALSGANAPADTTGRVRGLVTAEELSTLDLSNCDLAVLSACDTNVGERRAGQGVASLQRALHMAGAHSVITSLWKVPDEATKELMLDFYRRLWAERKPKHQALWEAKMKLREARDERGAPKYTTRDWAAWILTGNPD